MAGAERLRLPPGLGKSELMLRQVPEQVWKLCGKIDDWCPKISVFFSASIYATKKLGTLLSDLPSYKE
jgi:hypothetical protein